MRKLAVDEVREYPWGFEPQPGYEYFEVRTVCGADDHYGHPYCIIDEEPPVGAEMVSYPVLTPHGWFQLYRIRVGA